MFINIFNIYFNLFWANILLKFSKSLLSIFPMGFEELLQEIPAYCFRDKDVLVKIIGYLIFKIKRFPPGISRVG